MQLDGDSIMTTGVIRTGNSTGIGTGTTRTEITPAAGLFMPDDAVVLMMINPRQGIITPTAGQTVNTKIELASSSIKDLTPFNVIAPPIGSGLGAMFNTFTGEDEWDINAKLNGGEGLHVWATALVLNTVAPEVQAFLTISNDPRDKLFPWGQPKPQYHAELGTLTATGVTADTDVNGTKYSISGAQMVTELFGTFHPKTLATGDMYIGEIKYISTEFRDSYDHALPLRPLTFGLANNATGSMHIPGVSRKKVKIPTKSMGQVNIQDKLNFGGAIGTEGSFVDGVVYV